MLQRHLQHPLQQSARSRPPPRSQERRADSSVHHSQTRRDPRAHSPFTIDGILFCVDRPLRRAPQKIQLASHFPCPLDRRPPLRSFLRCCRQTQSVNTLSLTTSRTLRRSFTYSMAQHFKHNTRNSLEIRSKPIYHGLPCFLPSAHWPSKQSTTRMRRYSIYGDPPLSLETYRLCRKSIELLP